MAAGHHRWQVRVAPRTAGENIADAVDTDGAASLLGPLDEQVAGLAVQVSQRQTAHPTLDRSPETGKLHQRLPQTLAVDVPMG
ncbi:hypothetical protein D3C77_645520 [compost metagenome]